MALRYTLRVRETHKTLLEKIMKAFIITLVVVAIAIVIIGFTNVRAVGALKLSDCIEEQSDADNFNGTHYQEYQTYAPVCINK